MSNTFPQCRDRQAAAKVRPARAASKDAELLARFARRHDESAFEELVRRHGAMVMGVCRRVLNNRHDAEDAFQATFLVLARKSSAIQNPELLGNWLYGVAYRTALKARSTQPKSIAMSDAHSPTEPAGLDVARREMQSVIDEELHQLSEGDRLVLTLCYLQGLTHAEVADRLGWRQGSVSRRVARARELLRVRLTRRGLTLSVGLLTLLLTQMGASAAVPAALIESTVKASVALAAGRSLEAITSLRVASLTRGIRVTSLPLMGVLLLALLFVGPCGLAVDSERPAANAAFRDPAINSGTAPGDGLDVAGGGGTDTCELALDEAAAAGACH